ncbi:MAG: hypothetical protein WA210_14800 [Burkholderiaceae bacterium]
MTVFRWIMLVITGGLVTGMVASFVLFIVVDAEVWIERARTLRRLAFAAGLFWFNVEIWGRVLWTLTHWGSA